MKIIVTILCFAFILPTISGQNSESKILISKIDQLFDGMRSNDSTSIKGLFTESCSLSSIFTNREGQVVKRSNPVQGFISAVGRPHDKMWDEKIWSYDVKIDGPMAYVWTEYTFYLGEELSHCGVNMFEFMNTEDGWMISGLTDTRRRDNCTTDPVKDIGNIVNSWHEAAGKGDEEIYFGSIGSGGIFIGTDATERWTKDEFEAWSKEYFERDSAWAFTPVSRNIELSRDGKVAWFDELLDTWMGTCRGSGVLESDDQGKWTISHYHLSIAVPNEVVNQYLELIGKSRE